MEKISSPSSQNGSCGFVMQEAGAFVRAAADIAEGVSVAAGALRDVCRVEAARLRVAELAGPRGVAWVSGAEWCASQPGSARSSSNP